MLEGVVKHDEIEGPVHVAEPGLQDDDAVVVAEMGVHVRVDAEEVPEPVVVEREQRLARARPHVQDLRVPGQSDVVDPAQERRVTTDPRYQGAHGIEASEGMIGQPAEPAAQRRRG
jgi:hypothetical protein